MALINCGECGKEISDRAVACIHCGCPLELIQEENQQSENRYICIIDNKQYDFMNIIKILKNGNQLDMVVEVDKSFKDVPEGDMADLLNYIKENDTVPDSYELKNYPKKIGHKMLVEFIVDFYIKKKKTTKKKIETISAPEAISCPKCGSTQIQMVKRNWTLLTGFMNNEIDRVCMNCKKKF